MFDNTDPTSATKQTTDNYQAILVNRTESLPVIEAHMLCDGEYPTPSKHLYNSIGYLVINNGDQNPPQMYCDGEYTSPKNKNQHI